MKTVWDMAYICLIAEASMALKLQGRKCALYSAPHLLDNNPQGKTEGTFSWVFSQLR